MRVPVCAAFALTLANLLCAEEVSTGFHLVCPYDQKLCADYDVYKVKLEATTSADNDTLTEFNEQLVDISKRTDKVAYDQLNIWPLTIPQKQSIFGAVTALRDKLSSLTLAAEPTETAQISRDLLALEREADGLVSTLPAQNASPEDLAAFTRKVVSLNERATAIWQRIRALSLNVDRAGPLINNHQVTPAGQVWISRLNPLEERVAELRDELRFLAFKLEGSEAPAAASGAQLNQDQIDTKLKQNGLAADLFEHRANENVPTTNATPLAANGNNPPGVNLTVSPSMLIDMRPPPELPRPAGAVSFAIHGGKTYTNPDGVLIHEDADPGSITMTRFLHAIGLSRTYGNPAARAAYTWQQTGGTCALAAQAELFAEIHGIPPTVENMKKLEDIFFEEARQKKFFTGNSADRGQRNGLFGGGGTADQYVGDLVGSPVKKHLLASDAELVRVVESGKMVHVAVTAKTLWQDPYYPGGHAIVVTGLERNILTRRVRGFYINDTGSDEGGRFVSAPQFFQAWHSRGSQFTEAL